MENIIEKAGKWFFERTNQMHLIVFIVSPLLSVAFSYFLYFWIANNSFFIKFDLFDIRGLLFCLIILSIVFAQIPRFLNIQKVQNIHNKESYIWYTQWILLNSIICHIFLSVSFHNLRLFFVSFLLFACYLLVFVVSKKIVEKSKGINCLDEYRFAYGSVGEDGNLIDSNLELSRYISDSLLDNKGEAVAEYFLIGRQGQGKSSVARMVTEDLYKKTSGKMLYTYISLTETNKASDFGKLFADRWFESLSEKYPIINKQVVDYVVDSLSRDRNKNILSGLISLLISFNITLRKTKAKVFDREVNYDHIRENIEKIDRYVNESVSKMFGGINGEIDEEIWLIVIDEIERSISKETMRVIEVIERLRHIGRKGLPIRIAFLLVFDEGKILSLNPKGITSDSLVREFLVSSRKRATKFYIPESRYGQFISGYFNKIGITRFKNKKLIVQGKNNLLDGFRSTLIFPGFSYSFAKRREDRGAFMASLLRKESYRAVSIVLDDFVKFYRVDQIRWNRMKLPQEVYPLDILCLCYIKSCWSQLYVFLEKIAFELEVEGKYTSDINKQNKPDEKIFEGLEKEYGLKIPFSRRSDFKILLEYICPTVYKYYFRNKDRENYDPENIFHENEQVDKKHNQTRVIRPFYLNAYFNFVFANSEYNQRNRILLGFKIGRRNDTILHLSDKELRFFGDFIRNIERSENDNLYIFVAKEIGKRLKKINYDVLGEDVFEGIVYEFCFQILWVLKGNNAKKYLTECVEILIDVLKSKMVQVGVKYRIISAFAYSGRYGGGGIDFEFGIAWRDHLNGNSALIEVINNVMKELWSRYGGETSIYDKESWPAYVLFQSWIDTDNNRNSILNIARKGLRKNRRWLDEYWKGYPTKEEFDNNPEMISFRYSGYSSSIVYMPLNILIDETIAEGSVATESMKKRAIESKCFISSLDEDKRYKDFYDNFYDLNKVRKDSDSKTLYRYLIESKIIRTGS